MQNSIIIPVYKNEENIPFLLEALDDVLKKLPLTEVVFVVDGSPDTSYLLLREHLPSQSFPSQLITHSRNFGSFTAIRTGLMYAKGEYISVMAADLQEPPELMAKFFTILHNGDTDVVFGERTRRADSWSYSLLSNAFWALYRRFVLPDIPKGGVDVFGCTTQVKDAILSIQEPNSSLLAQLFWIGFRRTFVPYERRQRMHGKSAWNIRRRFKYMIDSIFSFSDVPLMLILWLGITGLGISLLLGSIVIIGAILGSITVSGYASTVLVILFFSSLILFTQGIIGLYLWRTFENSKRRPLSLVMQAETITPAH